MILLCLLPCAECPLKQKWLRCCLLFIGRVFCLWVSTGDANESRQCLPGLTMFSLHMYAYASVCACVRRVCVLIVPAQHLGLWSYYSALTDALWCFLVAYERDHCRDLNAGNYIPLLEQKQLWLIQQGARRFSICPIIFSCEKWHRNPPSPSFLPARGSGGVWILCLQSFVSLYVRRVRAMIKAYTF